MSSIGYRQKGDGGPLYNPERDYAYITPTLMVRAIENLDRENMSQELAAWYDQNNITQEEISQIATALAEAQRDFVNAADPVNSLEQALNRRGFFNFRLPVRQLLFAVIGEVVVGAWFTAVREVSVVGEESPAQNNMARFSATVAEFARRTGAPSYDPSWLAEKLMMRNDVLHARLNALYNELQTTRAQLTAATAPPKICGIKRKTMLQRIKEIFLSLPDR